MRKISTVVVAGGAGFIGSGVVRQFINETDITPVNIKDVDIIDEIKDYSAKIDLYYPWADPEEEKETINTGLFKIHLTLKKNTMPLLWRWDTVNLKSSL